MSDVAARIEPAPTAPDVDRGAPAPGASGATLRREWLEPRPSRRCDEADEIALRHFRRDLEVMTKPDRSFVTAADQAIERLIRDRIRAAFPDHGLVGEEYGTEAGDAPIRWYIDPIDGTHNYIRGVPLFGTLLALEVDGELQVGGPLRAGPARALVRAAGRRRVGRRGAGTRGRGRSTSRGSRASATPRCCTARARHRRLAAGRPGFRRLLGDVWRERGFGDFWGYALLAEGAAEAMVEVGPDPWDAGRPAGPRRGGRRSGHRPRGPAERSIRGTLLASNGLLHEEHPERALPRDGAEVSAAVRSTPGTRSAAPSGQIEPGRPGSRCTTAATSVLHRSARGRRVVPGPAIIEHATEDGHSSADGAAMVLHPGVTAGPPEGRERIRLKAPWTEAAEARPAVGQRSTRRGAPRSRPRSGDGASARGRRVGSGP